MGEIKEEESLSHERRYPKRERKTVLESIIIDSDEETPVQNKKRKSIKKEEPEAKKKKSCLQEHSKEVIEKIKKFKKQVPKVGEYETGCCGSCTSLECIRAAKNNDIELLKKLLEDTTNVSDPFIQNDSENSLSIARKQNNLEMLKLLVNEKKNPKKRRGGTYYSFSLNTGSYSSLKNRHGFKVKESRGSKEGNTAFYQDGEGDDEKDLGNYPITKEILDFLIVEGYSVLRQFSESKFYSLVESGDLETAKLICKSLKSEDSESGFNTLHEEVLSFNGEELSKYIVSGITKKTFGNHSITPIHCAAINPNTKYLKELMEAFYEKKQTMGHHITDKNGRKPIHFAAVCSSAENLKYLIEECKSDPSDADSTGMNAFLLACKFGKLECIKYLSSDEFEILKNSKNNRRFTGLHLAALGGHFDVVNHLVKSISEISVLNSVGETPLSIAAEKGYYNIVECLLNQDLNWALEQKGDKRRKNPLHYAAMNGHFEIVKILLLHGFDANSTDSSGNSVAHYAAAFGKLEILKLLELANADFNVMNDWATTPLSISIVKEHLKISEYLLQNPDINVNFVDDNNETMLHHLLYKKEGDYLKQVDYLVNQKKANVDIVSVDGVTLLHILASSNSKDDLALAKLLVQNGAPFDKEDSYGNTPLFIAYDSQNLHLIRYFLELNADVMKKNDKNQNILHLMNLHISNRFIQPVFRVIAPFITDDQWKILRSEVDVSGSTPLLTLINTFQYRSNYGKQFNFLKLKPNQDKNEEIRTVNRYDRTGDNSEFFSNYFNDFFSYTSCDINIQQKDGSTALHLSLSKSQDFNRLSKFLLENGADPNIKDNKGMTCLHIVAKDFQLNLAAAKDLISYKADVNAKDNHQQTPLHYICKILERKALLLEFIQAGTNVNELDEENKTALHLALVHHQPASFISTLLSSGAKSEIKDIHGRIPLHYSMMSATNPNRKPLEIEQLLISHNSNINELDNEKRTCLHYLFIDIPHHNDPVNLITSLFFSCNDIDVQQKDIYGRSVLHEASAKGSNISSMYLIQKGSKLNDDDEDGNSPLVLAFLNGYKDFGLTLINKGAKVNRTGLFLQNTSKPSNHLKSLENSQFRFGEPKPIEKDETMSLLRIIMKKDWIGLVYYLLPDIPSFLSFQDAYFCSLPKVIDAILSKSKVEDLSSLDEIGESLFFKIVKQSKGQFSITVLEKLIQKIGNSLINKPNNSKEYLIHYVVKTENVLMLECLLKHGVDVNSQDKDGKTPLMISCMENFTSIAMILIEHKSKVTLVDNNKRNALFYLVTPNEFGSHENIDLANILIEKGVDLSSKDAFKFSVVYYAAQQSSQRFYNEFMKHNAKKETKTKKISVSTPYINVDVELDSKNARKQIETSEDPMDVENIIQVDPKSGFKHGEVVKDKNGVYFDIHLSKCNIQGEISFYSFYRMQLIYNPFTKIYYLWTKWGKWYFNLFDNQGRGRNTTKNTNCIF
jgi:ankyrin repeat protein